MRPGGWARRSPLRGADAAAAGPARRRLAAHARGGRRPRAVRDDPPMHEPGSRETAVVLEGELLWSATAPPRPERRATRSPSTPTCPTTSRTRPTAPATFLRVIAAGLRRRKELDHAADHVREDLGGARGARPSRRGELAALHRPASRPRGHVAAGLRGPAPGRPQGAPPRPHAGDGRSQRAHRPARATAPTRSPTSSRASQVDALERNCEEFGIPLYGIDRERQGIVHVIGPELGAPSRA